MGHEKQPKAKIMKALAKIERAREPAPKGKDPFDTNEKKIAELRKQRDPKLGQIAVNRYEFIDALIEEYDARLKVMAILQEATTALLARAEKAEEDVIKFAKWNGELLAQTVRLETENTELKANTIGAIIDEAINDGIVIAAEEPVLVQGLTGTAPQGFTASTEPTLNAEEVAREAGDTHEVGGEG
jgi:hypothetical protein